MDAYPYPISFCLSVSFVSLLSFIVPGVLYIYVFACPIP